MHVTCPFDRDHAPLRVWNKLGNDEYFAKTRGAIYPDRVLSVNARCFNIYPISISWQEFSS